MIHFEKSSTLYNFRFLKRGLKIQKIQSIIKYDTKEIFHYEIKIQQSIQRDIKIIHVMYKSRIY